MTPFDGFLSGTRGVLLGRNLILRLLNRPRLRVQANVANLWVEDGTMPLTIFASVANPSPHPLVLKNIGVAVGKRGVAFPDELKAILGPLAPFDSRHATMTVEAFEDFMGRFEGRLPLPDLRIVVTDGLGKDWSSRPVKVPEPAPARDAALEG
jgi:hypothetical protein